MASPVAGPSADGATLAAIAGACRDQERLRFAYRAAEGSRARRLVEPLGLVHTGRRWYLVAWDTARTDWRTFRVDRIEAAPATDRRFIARTPPAEDLAAYVSRGSAGRGTAARPGWCCTRRWPTALRVPPAVGTLERRSTSGAWRTTRASQHAVRAMPGHVRGEVLAGGSRGVKRRSVAGASLDAVDAEGPPGRASGV